MPPKIGGAGPKPLRFGAMAMRALRGATTVDQDDPAEIKTRTVDLLTELFSRNDIDHDQVVSILFTTTGDITSLPPAAAAREFGLVDVPLLCAQEMAAEVGPDYCIRLMLHLDTETPRSGLRHVFLRGATVLRPDLAEPGDEAR